MRNEGCVKREHDLVNWILCQTITERELIRISAKYGVVGKNLTRAIIQDYLNSTIKVGDNVMVPAPNPNGTDIWNFGFAGIVNDIIPKDSGQVAIIEDGDSDFFEVEVSRLTKIEGD